jgi:hypothetical protein
VKKEKSLGHRTSKLVVFETIEVFGGDAPPKSEILEMSAERERTVLQKLVLNDETLLIRQSVFIVQGEE